MGGKSRKERKKSEELLPVGERRGAMTSKGHQEGTTGSQQCPIFLDLRGGYFKIIH